MIKDPDVEILGVSKITSSYNVKLIKEVRDFLKVEYGDRIVWFKRGDQIIVEKA